MRFVGVSIIYCIDKPVYVTRSAQERYTNHNSIQVIQVLSWLRDKHPKHLIGLDAQTCINICVDLIAYKQETCEALEVAHLNSTVVDFKVQVAMLVLYVNSNMYSEAEFAESAPLFDLTTDITQLAILFSSGKETLAVDRKTAKMSSLVTSLMKLYPESLCEHIEIPEKFDIEDVQQAFIDAVKTNSTDLSELSDWLGMDNPNKTMDNYVITGKLEGSMVVPLGPVERQMCQGLVLTDSVFKSVDINEYISAYTPDAYMIDETRFRIIENNIIVMIQGSELVVRGYTLECEDHGIIHPLRRSDEHFCDLHGYTISSVTTDTLV